VLAVFVFPDQSSLDVKSPVQCGTLCFLFCRQDTVLPVLSRILLLLGSVALSISRTVCVRVYFPQNSLVPGHSCTPVYRGDLAPLCASLALPSVTWP
jgi:hypothetical protein